MSPTSVHSQYVCVGLLRRVSTSHLFMLNIGAGLVSDLFVMSQILSVGRPANTNGPMNGPNASLFYSYQYKGMLSFMHKYVHNILAIISTSHCVTGGGGSFMNASCLVANNISLLFCLFSLTGSSILSGLKKVGHDIIVWV